MNAGMEAHSASSASVNTMTVPTGAQIHELYVGSTYTAGRMVVRKAATVIFGRWPIILEIGL